MLKKSKVSGGKFEKVLSKAWRIGGRERAPGVAIGATLLLQTLGTEGRRVFKGQAKERKACSWRTETTKYLRMKKSSAREGRVFYLTTRDGETEGFVSDNGQKRASLSLPTGGWGYELKRGRIRSALGYPEKRKGVSERAHPGKVVETGGGTDRGKSPSRSRKEGWLKRKRAKDILGEKSSFEQRIAAQRTTGEQLRITPSGNDPLYRVWLSEKSRRIQHGGEN